MWNLFNSQSNYLRWLIQLIFALLAIPAFILGMYIMRYVFYLIPSFGSTLGDFVRSLPPYSFSRMVFLLLTNAWWYYLASIYAHYWFDKGTRFDYSIIKSPRLGLLIILLFAALIFWNDAYPLSKIGITVALAMPFISIVFTWWLSELYCRFIRSMGSGRIDGV
jgi:hypothetical protein